GGCLGRPVRPEPVVRRQREQSARVRALRGRAVHSGASGGLRPRLARGAHRPEQGDALGLIGADLSHASAAPGGRRAAGRLRISRRYYFSRRLARFGPPNLRLTQTRRDEPTTNYEVVIVCVNAGSVFGKYQLVVSNR